MSDKPVYTGVWFPSQKIIDEAGAKPVATSFFAANDKQARAKATLLFVEQYPDADDAEFEVRIYPDTVGVPRPGVDAWSEAFMTENVWDDALGHPVSKPSPTSIEFDKLSPILRLCVLVKYDTTDVTDDMLPAALELAQDDEDTFDGHIVEALQREKSIMAMYPEHICSAVSWVRAKFGETAKWPDIKIELVNWKKRHDAERSDPGTSKSVVDIARENAANKTINAARAGTGTPPRPARTYRQTYETLDQEVASALWPGDVTPGNVDGKIYRWAKTEVIGKEREDWKRLSVNLRTQPDILRYDALTVFDLVRERPENVHKSPAMLNNYITEFLSNHGVFEDESKPAASDETASLDNGTSAAGAVEQNKHDDETVPGALETASSVERTGPFYFLYADGVKIGRANKQPGLEKALADGGTEISQEEYQSRKNGTFTNAASDVMQPDPVPATDSSEDSEPRNDDPDTASVAATPASFVVRADELERELGDSENLGLWKSVMRTNPRYTKDLAGAGFEGTSINAQYMIMRATEKFGPVGTGWGFEILEDKMIPGAPLTEKIFEGPKFVGKRILRDGDGSLMTEQNHYLKIRLWYVIECDVRGEIEAYGATPYLYTTKNGIFCDSEVHKKSLTDAIKKGLSHLGFSADVWLGLYDDPAYKAESHIEFSIKDASERADDTTRIREELDARFKGNVETMRHAVSPNEVSKIASSLTRTIAVHLKSAKETADNEYAKYLEGRLRRLEEVKAECLKNMEEAA